MGFSQNSNNYLHKRGLRVKYNRGHDVQPSSNKVNTYPVKILNNLQIIEDDRNSPDHVRPPANGS